MADRADMIRKRLRSLGSRGYQTDQGLAPPAARQTSQPPEPQTREPAPSRARPGVPSGKPGKIEREKRIMKLSCARRAQFFKYLFGLIMLGAGGYVYLFRPVELNLFSGFLSIDYIASALSLIGIIIILYAEARERGAHYYISQFRIVEISGLLRKREHGLQLSLIESVKTHQTFFQRLLGIGDVEVKSSRDSIILKKVGDPAKAEAMILSETNRRSTRSARPAQFQEG